MYKLFLISLISSYAYSVTPSFSAIVVLEQQNSNLNGVNWDKIENQANQQGLKNPNGLLYNKKIDKICSDCYFFDNYNFYNDLNSGILKYTVYPTHDSESNYQINAYVAVARCGEFYVNQKSNLLKNGLFETKVLCGNNPAKSIILTIALAKTIKEN